MKVSVIFHVNNYMFFFLSAFEFIRNLLTLLLQHGLDPNVRYGNFWITKKYHQ